MTMVAVLLTCSHEVHFRYAPPRVGQRVYCTRCEDMRAVTGGPGDYRAVCDNCTWRVTRKRLTVIRDNVAQHLNQCTAHTVTFWQMGTRDVYKVQHKPASQGGPILGGLDSPDTLL